MAQALVVVIPILLIAFLIYGFYHLQVNNEEGDKDDF